MQEEIRTQNRVAKNYEKRYSGTGLVYHADIIAKLLSGIESYKTKILDVGCGTGFVSDIFPYLDITGIDVSREMLKRNPHNCQIGSAEEIPFKDESYDFVLSRALLHHLDNPKKGVREMMRVLKPGGEFVCLETNRSIINAIPRYLFTFTPRFSRGHKNFSMKQLLDILDHKELKINEIRFIGYIAYPLAGFPDFINLKLPLWAGRFLMRIDDFISKIPLIKTLSFNVMIKGEKIAKT